MSDGKKTISESNAAGLKRVSIQELERNRISCDLHDTVVQNLTGLVLKGELCSRLIDIDPARARIELASMVDTVADTIKELRDTIFDLRPPSLSDFGLVQGVEDYCENINKVHNISFSVSADGNDHVLSSEAEINLYRIAQEACTNIIKHSKASRADISFVFSDSLAVMTVSDNGIGISDTVFGNGESGENRNFGILIMKERAELLNGTFSISSGEHCGTTIRIDVPII